MLTLHIANKNYSSWSLRPWVLMRQLGIDFQEELHPFDASRPGYFQAFSPTAKVPCLTDGDLIVWDSLAIAEYLAESHAGVWPAERQARAWARCAAAEMHAGFQTVRSNCPMNCALRVRLDPVSDTLKAEWRRLDTLWNDGLERFGGPFLAGRSFTAVDGFFAPVAFRVQSYQPQLSPGAAAYVQRLLNLPAMRAWYEAALTEPWRDEPHEAEIRGLGDILHDYRRPQS
ncbi:MAG: glutathione S-transferase family protein [Pseudomonadales bacterium]|nr:glutathione S-transferase family protein [Pseudomonadales bacterium]